MFVIGKIISIENLKLILLLSQKRVFQIFNRVKKLIEIINLKMFKKNVSQTKKLQVLFFSACNMNTEPISEVDVAKI